MKRKLALIIASLLLSIIGTSEVRAQNSGGGFSDWGPLTHLAPPINSVFDDQAPVLSRDEKTLFFTSNRPGTLGGEDIWVSTRKTTDSAWRTPVNLGQIINTSGIERLRSLTADGRVLLFMSDREGSSGETDIWAAVRENTGDNFSWSKPVNLGPFINSENPELAARYLFADSGRISKLFFSSSRPGGFGGPDIYESSIGELGFEPAVNVFKLNSPSVETCFWVREDGLEMIFISNRPDLTGNLNHTDLWAATRDSVYDTWSTPVKLGPSVNAEGYQDVNPSLSFDGRILMLASRRPGGIGPGTFDIYMTTRQMNTK